MKNVFVFMLSASVLFMACDTDPIIEPITDLSAELKNLGEGVIVPTYADLDAKTALLVSVLSELNTNPSPQLLEDAQQAWRDARVPWEQSEGFLFGPVDQQGIDPAMDSWPVNVVDLDNVLSGTQPLTKSYLDGLEGTLKGFHTIEYLLFGADGLKTPSDFTPRQFEYLLACAESLKGETLKLYNAWLPSGSNFIKNLLLAGTSSSIYPSQIAATQEAVNGMIAIADEVANGKIYDPLSQQNVLLEESRFSSNSKTDFADNIRSIRNVYLGSVSGTSPVNSLSALLAKQNPDLDLKIKTRIEDAINDIESIPGTFTTAIFDHQTEVIAAQNAVRDLQEILQSDLLPFIQNL